ncbi:hypothetical protein F2Q69_00043559 [Brassica cretica]|uniref:Uncharacterized protein n=1 Tax=Brassica cretica TaxID=69181 RepID=A0A8S9NK06_BRACR|nr:hypothetical protein F2Q69_00043559 [Brassica cretica]
MEESPYRKTFILPGGRDGSRCPAQGLEKFYSEAPLGRTSFHLLRFPGLGSWSFVDGR